jgi:hypothetical protein
MIQFSLSAGYPLTHSLTVSCSPASIQRRKLIVYLENQGVIDTELSGAAKHSKLKVLLVPMTVGSLDNPPKKGIFITTGSFSKEAQEFISKIDTKIVLIDGKELVELMLDHNVGVSVVRSVEIKKIDSDYFEELT